MATTGTKISEMTEQVTINGSEYIPIVDGNTNKKLSIGKLATSEELASVKSLDVSDILNRINQSGASGGNCTDEDFEVLKNCAMNGIVAHFKIGERYGIVNIFYNLDELELTYDYLLTKGFQRIIFKISSTKVISGAVKEFYDFTHAGDSELGSYTKPAAYSVVTSNDSVSTAIGKLEAGLGDKSEKVKSQSLTDTSVELQSNKYYVFGEVAALNITLASGEAGILHEYMFEFTSGDTPTTLSLPDSVKWIGSNVVESGKTYQISIVNNIAVMGGV